LSEDFTFFAFLAFPLFVSHLVPGGDILQAQSAVIACFFGTYLTAAHVTLSAHFVDKFPTFCLPGWPSTVAKLDTIWSSAMGKPDPGSNGMATKPFGSLRQASRLDGRDLEKDDPPPKSPNSPPLATTTGNRFLTASEWAKLAHGLGAVYDGSEKHSLVHPTSWLWPPKGLPSGLYKDVIIHETYYMYKFHLISGFRWALCEPFLWHALLENVTRTYLTPVTSISDPADCYWCHTDSLGLCWNEE
jgi:hypothetical protein